MNCKASVDGKYEEDDDTEPWTFSCIIDSLLMDKNLYLNNHLRMIRDRLDETKEVLSPAKVAARPINPLQVSSDEDEEDDDDDEIRKPIGNPKTTGESSEDENSNLKSSSSTVKKRKLKNPPTVVTKGTSSTMSNHRRLSRKSVANLFPKSNDESSDMEISNATPNTGNNCHTSKKQKTNNNEDNFELFGSDTDSEKRGRR